MAKYKKSKKVNTKHLWVLVWPSRRLLGYSDNHPLAFFTKHEALRYKLTIKQGNVKIVKFQGVVVVSK